MFVFLAPFRCSSSSSRILQISDDWVVRLLINQGRVENTVLSDSRRSLENELKELGGGVGWSRDFFNVRVFPFVYLFRF